jgi:hypothetical protein
MTTSMYTDKGAERLGPTGGGRLTSEVVETKWIGESLCFFLGKVVLLTLYIASMYRWWSCTFELNYKKEAWVAIAVSILLLSPLCIMFIIGAEKLYGWACHKTPKPSILLEGHIDSLEMT